MSVNSVYAIVVIIIMALVTFATRAMPFLIFGGRKKNGGEPPRWVKQLGEVLPPAVIALLVVYCLRNIDVFSGNHGLPEFLCVMIAALLHLWKRNELISIFGSTAIYMFLVQVIFV